MLYNVPLCKVEGVAGWAEREDAARWAQPRPENRGSLQRPGFLPPSPSLLLRPPAPALRQHHLSKLQPGAPRCQPWQLQTSSSQCTHLASGTKCLGVVPRAGLGCDLPPLLTTAVVQGGAHSSWNNRGEAPRPS